MYIRSTSRAFEKSSPRKDSTENIDRRRRIEALYQPGTYPNDEGRAEAITWNNLRDIIRAYTAISHLSNGRAFERDIFVALLLSVIKNKFRQTVRRKRFLEIWRLTKHQARTTHTRRIVAIQIYVSFRPFRRSSRAVSDQFLVWKKAVSLRENKNLSRVFSRVFLSSTLSFLRRLSFSS